MYFMLKRSCLYGCRSHSWPPEPYTGGAAGHCGVHGVAEGKLQDDHTIRAQAMLDSPVMGIAYTFGGKYQKLFQLLTQARRAGNPDGADAGASAAASAGAGAGATAGAEMRSAEPSMHWEFASYIQSKPQFVPVTELNQLQQKKKKQLQQQKQKQQNAKQSGQKDVPPPPKVAEHPGRLVGSRGAASGGRGTSFRNDRQRSPDDTAAERRNGTTAPSSGGTCLEHIRKFYTVKPLPSRPFTSATTIPPPAVSPADRAVEAEMPPPPAEEHLQKKKESNDANKKNRYRQHKWHKQP